MKHKHHDIIVAWAADTSKVVQIQDPYSGAWLDQHGTPSFPENSELRFKPELKPDVVAVGIVATDINVPSLANYHTIFRVSEHYERDNLRLTFDGETGKLIKAEVL